MERFFASTSMNDLKEWTFHETPIVPGENPEVIADHESDYLMFFFSPGNGTNRRTAV